MKARIFCSQIYKAPPPPLGIKWAAPNTDCFLFYELAGVTDPVQCLLFFCIVSALLDVMFSDVCEYDVCQPRGLSALSWEKIPSYALWPCRRGGASLLNKLFNFTQSCSLSPCLDICYICTYYSPTHMYILFTYTHIFHLLICIYYSPTYMYIHVYIIHPHTCIYYAPTYMYIHVSNMHLHTCI